MQRFQNTGQPDWDWWGKLWPTPGATLRRLGIASGDTLAEVPCGNGYFALPAAKITAPAPVYGIDLDESLLDELDRTAERHEIGNVVTLHGDARALANNLPERVDVVLVANTFHGVGDTADFVSEVYDSLEPGGRFIVVNWHDEPREETPIAGDPRGPPSDLRMSPAATEEVVLDGAAFSPADHVELPPYHYARVFDR